MNWIDLNTEKPIIPKEPVMSFGWSNHLLAYSKKEDCWFEAVYNFNDNEFYLLDHEPLKEFEITHFCEDVPTPQ